MEAEDVYYPKTSDIETWESFLNRQLTIEEKLYLMDVVIEKGLNKEIYLLQENLKIYFLNQVESIIVKGIVLCHTRN